MSKQKHPRVVRAFLAVPFEDQADLLLVLASHFDINRLDELNQLKAKIARLENLKRKADSVKQFVQDTAGEGKKSRRKPKPTHQSKKDLKLFWSGRGSLPTWMRQEMKALRLKPDAFLIKSR